VHTQVSIAEACDDVLAAEEQLEETQVGWREQMEAGVGASSHADLLRDAVDRCGGNRGVIDTGEEREIAVVGCHGELPRVAEAVDALVRQLLRQTKPQPLTNDQPPPPTDGRLSRSCWLMLPFIGCSYRWIGRTEARFLPADRPEDWPRRQHWIA